VVYSLFLITFIESNPFLDLFRTDILLACIIDIIRSPPHTVHTVTILAYIKFDQSLFELPINWYYWY